MKELHHVGLGEREVRTLFVVTHDKGLGSDNRRTIILDTGEEVGDLLSLRHGFPSVEEVLVSLLMYHNVVAEGKVTTFACKNCLLYIGVCLGPLHLDRAVPKAMGL
jgi:hypothetical protein